jgi:hypothetical protein
MGIAAARGVHLVGSIGLLTAQDVFRKCGQLLGPRLKRVPDGEVGGRRLWVTWQFPLLRSMPFLAPVDRSQGVLSRMKLADGVGSEDVYFGELGYAREARTSYEDFLSARKAGHLPERVKFMIAMPTPYAVPQAFVDPNALRVVEPAYTAAMIAEVKRICDAIPHKDLAIQWDVCFEMLVWDGGSPNWQWRADGDPRAEIVRRLKVLAEVVPGPMVDLSNTLATTIPRKIDWIHMPVPVERTDDAYFAPLDKLRTKPETDVYLGLVHLKDGIDGARKRIAAAEAHLDRFGVSTECGFARVRTPVVVERILEIHAEID